LARRREDAKKRGKGREEGKRGRGKWMMERGGMLAWSDWEGWWSCETRGCGFPR
jgi:hypothetical protein